MNTITRQLLEKEWHEKSLDKTGTGVTFEVEIVNKQIEDNADSFEDEEEHGDEPCDDPHCVCHQDCEVNECETCFEKWIDDGDRAYDQMRDDEMEAFNAEK